MKKIVYFSLIFFFFFLVFFFFLKSEQHLKQHRILMNENEKKLKRYSEILCLSSNKLLTFEINSKDNLNKLRKKITYAQILAQILNRSFLFPKIEEKKDLTQIFSKKKFSTKISSCSNKFKWKIPSITKINLKNESINLFSLISLNKNHLLQVKNIDSYIFWEQIKQDASFSKAISKLNLFYFYLESEWYSDSIQISSFIVNKAKNWLKINLRSSFDCFLSNSKYENENDFLCNTLQKKKKSTTLFTIGKKPIIKPYLFSNYKKEIYLPKKKRDTKFEALIYEAISQFICIKANSFHYPKNFTSDSLVHSILFKRLKI